MTVSEREAPYASWNAARADGRRSGRLRSLGTVERFFHLLSGRSNVHFCFVAELRGALDDRMLARAAGQVVRRHPFLSARIGAVPTDGLVFLGGDPPAPATSRMPAGGWRAAVGRELADTIGLDGSPLFRLTALLGDSEAALILTFHHAIADGRSAAMVLEDLMSALSGRELTALEVPPSLETCAGLADSSAGDWRTGSTIAPGGSGSGRAPLLETAVIDGETTAILLRASRANGATLHGAMCAALARSGLARRSPDRSIIMSPVDLRSATGASPEACAALIAGVTTSASPGADFWGTARDVSKAAASLREAAALRALLGKVAGALPPEADVAAAMALWEGAFESDATLTNLGALPHAQRYADLEVTALWGPVVRFDIGTAPTIGVLGFGGALHLVEARAPGCASVLDRLRSGLLSVADAAAGDA